MKEKLKVLAGIVLLATFCVCCGDDDPVTPSGGDGNGEKEPTEDTRSAICVTGDASDILHIQATLTGYVNLSPAELATSTFGAIWGTEETLNWETKESYAESTELEDNKYTVRAKDMQAGTKYYYRCYARVGTTYVYGKVRSFTTRAFDESAIVTGDATDIRCTSAILSASVNLPEEECTSVYLNFIWGQNETLTSGTDLTYSGFYMSDGRAGRVGAYSLEYGTRYYYRAYMNVGRSRVYGEIKTFTTNTIQQSGAVDLGLPSGTLWAACNVGAEKPEDFGDYFAWGETEGYNSGKTNFSWETYRWGDFFSPTKYGTWYGVKDGLIELEAADDAATVIWGADWRMPSEEQLAELRAECIWSIGTMNGIEGYFVESKTKAAGIFLPEAGHYDVMNPLETKRAGYYWSRTLCSGGDSPANSLEYCNGYACCFQFISTAYSNLTISQRCLGQSVRPVRMK